MRQRAKGPNVDKPQSGSQQQGQTPAGSHCHIMIVGLSALITTLCATILVIYFLQSPASHPTHEHSGSFALKSPQFTGVYAVNNELLKARRLFEGELFGPESFAVDKDGYLYTGLMDGRVVKIDLQTESFTLVTRMGDAPYSNCGKFEMMPHCGRPLGIRFDNNGSLIVVDSYKGLFSVNTMSGQKKLLFKPEESGEFSCAVLNNPVVLSNGSIYFTCLSTKFALHAMFASDFPINDFLWDPSKNNDTGSLFHYNPTTGRTTLVEGKQLFCPNGVTKSSNEDFLVIAELSRHRVARYYLKGPKAGEWDIFLSNLPGIVDNITPSKRTPGFWVAIPSVRPTALLDFSYRWSRLQHVTAKLGLTDLLDHPNALHTMLLLVDEEGTVIRCLHDPLGQVVQRISEGLEINNELIIGSFFAPFMAKMTLY